VDIILFNPPYVPTWSEESLTAQNLASIEGSWAGGVTGMEVTDRFLDQVEMLLSPKGIFYLVAVRENNVPDIRSRMLNNYHLLSEIALERRAGLEYLYVVKFYRSP
jgi:release factor glutamine methyltransferase